MLTYQNSQSDQEMLKLIYFTLTTMQILKYSNTFQFLCYLIIPNRPHY